MSDLFSSGPQKSLSSAALQVDKRTRPNTTFGELAQLRKEYEPASKPPDVTLNDMLKVTSQMAPRTTAPGDLTLFMMTGIKDQVQHALGGTQLPAGSTLSTPEQQLEALIRPTRTDDKVAATFKDQVSALAKGSNQEAGEAQRRRAQEVLMAIASFKRTETTENQAADANAAKLLETAPIQQTVAALQDKKTADQVSLGTNVLRNIGALPARKRLAQLTAMRGTVEMAVETARRRAQSREAIKSPGKSNLFDSTKRGAERAPGTGLQSTD